VHCAVTPYGLEPMSKQFIKGFLNPRDHDYGTHLHELARAIAANIQKEAEYHDYSAMIADAIRPIGEVIDAILNLMAVK